MQPDSTGGRSRHNLEGPVPRSKIVSRFAVGQGNSPNSTALCQLPGIGKPGFVADHKESPPCCAHTGHLQLPIHLAASPSTQLTSWQASGKPKVCGEGLRKSGKFNYCWEMGISGCGASLASLMSAPPAAHAGWGRRRCRGAASGVGGCSRDS